MQNIGLLLLGSIYFPKKFLQIPGRFHNNDYEIDLHILLSILVISHHVLN